nr:unnamed protein product [Spirometra erinaceieuropaei]
MFVPGPETATLLNQCAESLEHIHLEECSYRGEGNNNIVLTNNKGTIYRIRKSSFNWLLPNKKTTAFRKKHQLTVLFGQHRMAQFFTAEFLPTSRLIDVDSAFLEEVDRKFAPQRPSFRLSRSVDVSTRQILAAPDATQIPNHLQAYGTGPTLCIEIKPKFGAILQGPTGDALDAVKHQNALFCLMQFHESKMRMWAQRSSYCPCDLFSGNRKRMLSALRALQAVPQNNFRVFHNGHLVLNNLKDRLDEALVSFFSAAPDQAAVVDCPRHHSRFSRAKATVKNHESSNGNTRALSPNSRANENTKDGCTPHSDYLRDIFLTDLVLEALLFNWSPSDAFVSRTSAFRYDCKMHFAPSNAADGESELALNSVLGRILSAQMMSSLGHKDIIPHFNRVRTYFEENHIKWNSFIAGKVDVDKSEAPQEVAESLTLVENHLVAMVARDCSLIIAFQRAKDDCPEWVPTIGGQCPCLPRTIINVTVVDLDPKSLTNLAERSEMERSVVAQYLMAMGSQITETSEL